MRDVTEQLRRYGDWVGAAVEAEPAQVPKRPNGRARLLLAVAAVLVLLAGAVVLLTMAGDDDTTTVDEPDTPRRLTPAQTVVESRHVIWALQDERAATVVHLLGAEDLVDLPVEDLGEARRRTDGAIDSLREVFGDEEVGELAALRTDVDALPVANLLDLDPVVGLVQRYDDLVSVILGANDDVARRTDDPGVTLVASGLEADETTVRLSFLLLQGMVSGGGLDTPTEISEASFQLTMLKDLRSDIARLASGTRYEDAARALDQAVTEDGFVERVEAYLGPDAAESDLFNLLDLPSDGVWRAFVEDVVADLDD